MNLIEQKSHSKQAKKGLLTIMSSVALVVIPTALFAFLHSSEKTPLESAIAVCAPATDPNLSQSEFVEVLAQRASQLNEDGWTLFDPDQTQHIVTYRDLVSRNKLLEEVERKGEDYGQLYDMTPPEFWAVANAQKLHDDLQNNLDPIDDFTYGLWLVSEDLTAVIKLDGPSDRDCLFFAASDQVGETDLADMDRQAYVGISDDVYTYRYNQNVRDKGGIRSAFKMDSSAFTDFLKTDISSAWRLEIVSQNWNLR